VSGGRHVRRKKKDKSLWVCLIIFKKGGYTQNNKQEKKGKERTEVGRFPFK